MKYGRDKMKAFIEEKNILEIIESNDFKKSKTEDEIIAEVLYNPIDSERLKDIVHEGEKVCIIISDITRKLAKAI